MTNFLVTGDLGFIGSHLTDEELYNACYDVTVVAHLNNGDQNNVSLPKNKTTLYKSNLVQIKSTIFSKKFDIIFRLATAPRSSSLNDPLRDIETNCKGMISVLELAKKTTQRLSLVVILIVMVGKLIVVQLMKIQLIILPLHVMLTNLCPNFIAKIRKA